MWAFALQLSRAAGFISSEIQAGYKSWASEPLFLFWMVSLYISVAPCLYKNPILELHLWKSDVEFPFFMQVIACFVFLCKPHTLSGSFQRTILLGARFVLPVLTAGQLICHHGPRQRGVGSLAPKWIWVPLQPFVQIYLLSLSPREKEKKWPGLKTWSGNHAFPHSLYVHEYSPKVS